MVTLRSIIAGFALGAILAYTLPSRDNTAEPVSAPVSVSVPTSCSDEYRDYLFDLHTFVETRFFNAESELTRRIVQHSVKSREISQELSQRLSTLVNQEYSSIKERDDFVEDTEIFSYGVGLVDLCHQELKVSSQTPQELFLCVQEAKLPECGASNWQDKITASFVISCVSQLDNIRYLEACVADMRALPLLSTETFETYQNQSGD
ncbi:hypothetical protein COY27_04915 [Candidatus Woesearchaeota archaeon CG_4_10_14_0_2_um_filter_33_13]|nr:MAG: hypothetical protein COY27_04915 [Candidatus Woesearchaeota archaeon CG_4_10_14_0_2_um_filter_33_13]